MAGDGFMLMCTNRECSNERVFYADSSTGHKNPARCDLCGNAMDSIVTDTPAVEDKMLVERELGGRSMVLEWLTYGEISRWPGPVAFEYMRLRGIMADGNIEGSCWKMANLAEVTTGYLFAATIEISRNWGLLADINAISKKISFIRDFWKDRRLHALLDTLRDIMRWRNKHGAGHGSLVVNRESYINSLIGLGSQLNKNIGYFSDFISGNDLSLAGPGGELLTGLDYFFKLKWEGNTGLTCTGRREKNSLYPAFLFGYQFDGPDIYIIDSVWSDTFNYHNFRKNRSKYTDRSGNIVWEADPGQLWWLDPAERKSWYMHFKNDFVGTGSGKKMRQRVLLEMLVDAAEQFQSRGMSAETKWCLDNYNSYSKASESDNEFSPRIGLTRYKLRASMGEPGAAAELDNARRLAGCIEDRDRRILFLAGIDLASTWYRGICGHIEESLAACSDAIKNIGPLKQRYPLASSMLELQLKKNYLYLSRRVKERDNRRLREECMKVFQRAGSLYSSDPENHGIVDLIGFVCNLYGEYSLDLAGGESIAPGEKQHILSLYNYGEKIRERAYRNNPDDIWVMRGYAWCYHVRARFMARVNEEAEALMLFLKAVELRLRCEEKYPMDLGVKEDMVKNYVEILHLDISTDQHPCYRRRIIETIAFIKDREGESPRIRDLDKIVCEYTREYKAAGDKMVLNNAIYL